MVFSLRKYREIIHTSDIFKTQGKDTTYAVSSGNNMNPENPPNSYL